MKPRWTLSRKILLLAIVNLAVLAVMMLAFARAQFQFGPESLLLGPAQKGILAISHEFAAQWQVTPESGRDALLATYSRRYGAEFFLASGRGDPIAGPEFESTRELRDRIRRLMPPPGARPAPFPPPPPPPGGPDEPERKMPPRQALPPESVFLLITHSPVQYWAGARIELGDHPEGPGRYAVLLMRSDSLLQSNIFFDWRMWLEIALSVAAVTALCWLPFIRGLTRSISRMDRATAQIAEGRFDVHVNARRQDELGHLGQGIDRMATRLERYVTSQKRFLGDIAHELCAPIARIQFALGILEQKAAEEQRPHVAALHDEIQEMSALVNELLSFSRAALRSSNAELSVVPLAALAEKAVAREAFAGTPVELDIESGLTVKANEILLLRALSNVLRNAIRYAGASGPIAVSARREANQVLLTVSDSGPGLPAAELEEVFAPFYRPEAARTRDTGGAGLGLAIVRTCIEACRGTVMCRNRTPSGLEVIMRLESA